MPRRNIDNAWAGTGATTDPGSVKTLLGWIAEIPTYQNQNWWQRRADEMLERVEQLGIQDWLAATAYLIDGLSLGSDGVPYQAVIANSGNDPTTDVGATAPGTNWRSAAFIDYDFVQAGGFVIFNANPALILQWGEKSVAANTISDLVTLPTAYPTVHAVALGATGITGTVMDRNQAAWAHSTTQVRLGNASDVAEDVGWISIGW